MKGIWIAFLVAVLVTGILAINIISTEVYGSGQGKGNDDGKGKPGHGEQGCETAKAASEGRTNNPHCDNSAPPKRVSLRDLGIIQIATHDLVDVDRVAKIDREDGRLNLSTLFGHGEENIPLGGERRNFSNAIIFNVVQKEFVEFYFDLIDNQGMSKDEAIQKTVEKYHVELAGTFERIFDEPLPEPKDGTVTFTENLALRTLHDLIPGRIIIDGIEVNAFGISPLTPLTDEELMQLGAELDGVYDPELLAIFIPGRGFLNLLERDSTFATDLGTEFSLEFFLEELEDGAYDETDEVMKQLRNMFSKGINV